MIKELRAPETLKTVADALEWSTGRLAAARIESVRLEARLLVAHAAGISPQNVFSHPEWPLEKAARTKLVDVVGRRCRRIPMAHITGEREFWSLTFLVSPDTLIPRPDSETLVEAVLEAFPDTGSVLRVLDLGTGSGCLLLSLLHERRRWTGVGLDRSMAALKIAGKNAKELRLAERSRFVAADWSTQPLAGLGFDDFDLVIANPPYIPEADRDQLQPEVVDCEPSGALFAGADGLEAYRLIVPQAMEVLVPGGALFLEIGIGQADAVGRLLTEHGFSSVSERCDLSGIPRCLFARSEKH